MTSKKIKRTHYFHLIDILDDMQSFLNEEDLIKDETFRDLMDMLENCKTKIKEVTYEK